MFALTVLQTFLVGYCFSETIQGTHSGEVNGSGGDVNVHEIVNDAGLDVTLVFVDHHLFPRVVDLHEGHVLLFLFVQGIVLLLVVLYPLEEIGQSCVLVHVRVVRTAHFDFHYILFDDLQEADDYLVIFYLKTTRKLKRHIIITVNIRYVTSYGGFKLTKILSGHSRGSLPDRSTHRFPSVRFKSVPPE